MQNKKLLKKVKKLFLTSLAVMIICFLIFPFFWTIICSFKKETELFSKIPTISFSTWENYYIVLKDPFFINALKNSAIIAPSTTALTLLISIFSSYALARTKIPKKRMFLLLIVFFQMLPPVAYMVPYFIFFEKIGLIGTHIALIIAFTVLNLPLTIYLLKTFFESLPYGLEEAAMLDGASYFQIIFKIILPISLPGLVTVTIFAFIGAWNELLFALILSEESTITLPIKVVGYSQVSGHPQIAKMLTGSVIMSIPVTLLALIFSKYILKGLTAGAFKY
jgi:multiple sugar transport system permease protein